MPLGYYQATTWPMWVQSTATSTTVDCWPQWSQTTSTIPIWTGWNQLANSANTLGQQQQQYIQQQQAYTEQQIAALRAEQEAALNRQHEFMRVEQVRITAAEKRAQELLFKNLSVVERERFRKSGYIVVVGARARYRIRRGRIGNIDVINRAGFIVERLCAHPVDHVPDCDTILAQKLAIETDENAFLRIANKTAVGGERVLDAL